MKCRDIDIEKITEMLADIPDDFEIERIELTNNNYSVRIKYDYKAKEDDRYKQISADYQAWVREMDEYFRKFEEGDS